MTQQVQRTRSLQERLGRVYHQPLDVESWTNKRITVNYRVPLEQLEQLLPWCVTAEEIHDTGTGMLSMCACDFSVTKFGPIPVPRIHTNEMLCRISVTVPKNGRRRRAYYTLRSDTSSRVLGLCGGYFSHFRKATSSFDRVDDGETYELRCRADDPLCDAELTASMDSINDEPLKARSSTTSPKPRSSSSNSTGAAATTSPGRDSPSRRSSTPTGTSCSATTSRWTLHL